jgi:hypothetical protein
MKLSTTLAHVSTPLVFVERGVKINAKSYQQHIIRDVLEPWAIEHFGDHHWYLQQDWAPAHGAKTSVELCKRLFPAILDKDVWPANSPDLNAMDYSIWSILEQKISATRYATVEQLKAALQKAWDEISVETCASVVDNFMKRLNACIQQKGGHFEHLL